MRTRDDRLTAGDTTSAGREDDLISVVSGEVSPIAGLGSSGSIVDDGTIGGTFSDTTAQDGTASSTIEGRFDDTVFGGASLRLSDADGLLSLGQINVYRSFSVSW